MSIHTITVDEFMQLTVPQHRQALALYDREIHLLQELLAKPESVTGSPVSQALHVAKWQEELENFQKLRDVHQVRLDELAAPETDGVRVPSQLAA